MIIHQLIFVDDESIVRDGVKNCVPWGENGFNLAGIFENGQEAFHFIEENPVDVVISDINMPKMDGLTLSRILADKYPGITVILLTGYDEFEYARKAVKNKVREFLLKPITADELSSVLEKIHRELTETREKENQQRLIMEKLNLSFPLLKERFLFQLVSGKLDNENIDRRKKFFQWEDRNGFYQIMIISLPGNCGEIEALTLLEFVTDLKQPADEVFSDRDSNIILLLQDNTQEILSKRTRSIAEKAFLQAESLSLIQFYIGIGENVDQCNMIHQSYSEACNAAGYAKILGFSQIISIDDIREKEKISPFQFHSLEFMLTKQLKEGSREKALEALNNLMIFLKEHFVSSEEVSYYFTRIHTLLYYFIQEMDLFSSAEEYPPPPADILNSITRAEEYFINQINSIEDRIQTHRNDIVLSRIEKAKTVIAKKYRDKNFSLQDICSELFLSTSQFSVIFKEGTGQTFVEYLTSCRINEAKKLLKNTDMKGYEIAEAVGYADPRYFSIIFKKLTGVTPMEFRRNLE